MYGLLLGLSNGTACLSTCAPVILPYMLHSGKSVKGNCLCLLQFLSGRLAGYICAGMLAWLVSQTLLKDAVFRGRLLSVSYIFLGTMLICYSLKAKKGKCALTRTDRLLSGFIRRDSIFYPVALGLMTGINICPPFLIAFTEAAASSGMLASIFFFITFFIGTSVYFIPFPFLGLLRKNEAVKTLSGLTLYLIAGYYILKGIISLMGVNYGQ
jgi:sulfite exporter TauE/SafE